VALALPQDSLGALKVALDSKDIVFVRFWPLQPMTTSGWTIGAITRNLLHEPNRG
jgi:hypothetical protein